MVLRKTIEDRNWDSFTKNSNHDTSRRVISYSPNSNTLQASKTTVTTSPTLISVPETIKDFIVRHITSGVVIWVGEDETIAADGDNVFPLIEGDALKFEMRKGDANNLYAIVDSGTADIYLAGVTNT